LLACVSCFMYYQIMKIQNNILSWPNDASKIFLIIYLLFIYLGVGASLLYIPLELNADISALKYSDEINHNGIILTILSVLLGAPLSIYSLFAFHKRKKTFYWTAIAVLAASLVFKLLELLIVPISTQVVFKENQDIYIQVFYTTLLVNTLFLAYALASKKLRSLIENFA
jgi:hypothetical protein